MDKRHTAKCRGWRKHKVSWWESDEQTSMPSHEEFAELPVYLAKRGMKDAEINAVHGGGCIRGLRQAPPV